MSYKIFLNGVLARSRWRNIKSYVNNAELSRLFKTDIHTWQVCWKKKYVRASNSDFMTKDHRKEIMQTWKLRNKFLKQRADKAKALYNKEICVNLFCRSKRNYFRQKNTDTVSDSRIFCKTINHF